MHNAGCRGLRVGGAEVSEKHSNFLINSHRATAADIEALGRTLKVINIALVPALLTLGVLALWLWRRRRRA